jgi:signal transduction histidine kinase
LGSRLYMGAIAIMFLYNAIFFLMTFDLIYLVYVAFIAVSGSQVLSVQGFSYQYLWPQAVGFNHISVPFLMCTSVCLMSLFSIMSLAQLAKYKILYRTVQVHIVLGLLGCVGAFALPYSSSIKIAVFLTFSASISTLVAYGRLSWARFRPAYFFLMSLGTLLAASIVYSLKAVGVLPYNFFTENAPLIGSALQISMLTFGLADRFRELQAQHQLMQKQMIELQKDNIRKLDEQVAEKTADIRSILKTINQGIFTISGDDLTIDPEKSDALTLMFPDTALQKSDPIDAIFAKSRLTSDSIDQIKAGFTASLDSDALNFDLNAACFPKVFEMETATGQKKYFECDWSPILDQHENVKKILVAVRDTTEVRRLEEEARRKDQEMGTIMEILAIPSQKFAKAYHAISRLIQQVRETTNKGDQIAPRDWQQLYALLHTAKGNSRTFGLKQLAGMIHEVEEHVKELTDQRTEDLWQMLLSGLREIEAYLEYIARLAEEKLGRSLRESPLTLADEDWKKLIQSLGELEKLSPSQQVAGEVIDMRNRLLHLRYFDLQDVVGDMQQALRLAAEHLGKPFPQIVIQDKVGAYLKEDTSETLQSAFVHLLTNSLDHGIENPEKRVAAGKKAEGTITLEVRDYNDHSVEIRLSDDGAGLNLPVLQQLVAKKGLKDIDVTKASSLAESIFASGVSTHEKVSQLSGRGVGMDAVRALIQGMGGQIGIVFLSAQPSVDRFEPFCFQMIIPKEHFWISRASA